MKRGISDTQYLEAMLTAKKMELAEVKISHRVTQARYDVVTEMLNDQIHSIERQLGSGDSDGS